MAIREIARRLDVSVTTAWRVVRGHHGQAVEPSCPADDALALDLEALADDALTLRARGLSAAEIAAQLGVSDRTVRRWINGS